MSELLIWVIGATFTYGVVVPNDEEWQWKILGAVLCLSSWPFFLGSWVQEVFDV